VAGELALEPHFGRCTALGLIEESVDEDGHGERGYYVSKLVQPLLEEPAEDEGEGALRRALAALRAPWWEGLPAGKGTSEPRALELHRLALEVGEAGLAARLADLVSTSYVNGWRNEEAVALLERTLELGEDYRLLLNLARAKAAMGLEGAGEAYARAQALGEALGTERDDREYAAILHNRAGFLAQQGEVEEALRLYRDSLEIEERIGDVQGKAATLHAMAGIFAQQGEVEEALRLYRDSLALKERIGDVRGKAATLHNMAGIFAQQGEVEEALRLYRDSLDLQERIGDVQGKAATLNNMAGIFAQQGQVEEALRLYRDSLDLNERIGDVRGKAATLHNMAIIFAQQGQVEEALRLYRDSLDLKERIGDVQGKAATLHQMAGIFAQQGQVEEALRVYRDSLDLKERIGNVQGKAATLANMAYVADLAGDAGQARDLNLQAARALASIHAWPDLATVLANLGAADGGTPYLAQAVLLGLRVSVAASTAVQRLAALTVELAPTDETVPLLATTAAFLVASRPVPDSDTDTAGLASGLVGYAHEKSETTEPFEAWFKERRLDDPGYFIPQLERRLRDLVPADAWLFDPDALPTRANGQIASEDV
jgi:tetratricopeptide (TPR) repeat protein